jgi:hypothetical protein
MFVFVFGAAESPGQRPDRTGRLTMRNASPHKRLTSPDRAACTELAIASWKKQTRPIVGPDPALPTAPMDKVSDFEPL